MCSSTFLDAIVLFLPSVPLGRGTCDISKTGYRREPSGTTNMGGYSARKVNSADKSVSSAGTSAAPLRRKSGPSWHKKDFAFVREARRASPGAGASSLARLVPAYETRRTRAAGSYRPRAAEGRPLVGCSAQRSTPLGRIEQQLLLLRGRQLLACGRARAFQQAFQTKVPDARGVVVYVQRFACRGDQPPAVA